MPISPVMTKADYHLTKYPLSRGFTLIELVTVIILIGILAVVITPKLVDVEHDAIDAKMRQTQAAVKEMVSLVRQKAEIGPLIESLDDSVADGSLQAVKLNGITLSVSPVDHYPHFTLFRHGTESSEINAVLDTASDYDQVWWAGGFYLYPRGISDEQSDHCFVFYDYQARKVEMEDSSC